VFRSLSSEEIVFQKVSIKHLSYWQFLHQTEHRYETFIKNREFVQLKTFFPDCTSTSSNSCSFNVDLLDFIRIWIAVCVVRFVLSENVEVDKHKRGLFINVEKLRR
jgi:hypothetical protein